MTFQLICFYTLEAHLKNVKRDDGLMKGILKGHE